MIRGKNINTDPNVLYLLSSVRILLLVKNIFKKLYYRFCPYNVEEFQPRYYESIFLIGSLVGQILLIRGQIRFGVRFLIPAFLTPPKYNYFVPIEIFKLSIGYEENSLEKRGRTRSMELISVPSLNIDENVRQRFSPEAVKSQEIEEGSLPRKPSSPDGEKIATKFNFEEEPLENEQRVPCHEVSNNFSYRNVQFAFFLCFQAEESHFTSM